MVERPPAKNRTTTSAIARITTARSRGNLAPTATVALTVAEADETVVVAADADAKAVAVGESAEPAATVVTDAICPNPNTLRIGPTNPLKRAAQSLSSPCFFPANQFPPRSIPNLAILPLWTQVPSLIWKNHRLFMPNSLWKKRRACPRNISPK